MRLLVRIVPVMAYVALIGGCGNSAKPLAASQGTTVPAGARLGPGRVDDPRRKHVKCLRQKGLTVEEIGSTDLRIGTPSISASVHFEPTPGAAQQDQIAARTQGAEVIGSALLYPQNESESRLKQIEDCLSQGVKG